MTAPLRELLERLAKRHPKGPLFRTHRGQPWKPHYLAEAVRAVRERLARKEKPVKGKVIPYGYRHTVATDLLEAGVPDAQVAAVLGHQGTRMVYQHYGHLGARIKTLAGALDRVINQKGEPK